LKRVAWCITGSGDRIAEIVGVMEEMKKSYSDVDIRTYLSKAGEQVMKYYRLFERVKEEFEVRVEVNANSPFLAGDRCENSSRNCRFACFQLRHNGAESICSGLHSSIRS